MSREPAIVTSDLTCSFGKITAVDHLALEVYGGEIFGLLGHNGAGKTTTVRLLNGLLRPDAGSARVLGLDPIQDGTALRRATGVLTETPSLYEPLNARENLALYAELYDVPPAEVGRRIDELLEVFELADRATEPVRGYSKGMKQRLALARALLHKPSLLFLDEPTAGLDPMATHQVHRMIADLASDNHTIVLCTHNLVEAQALCTRVAVIERGRLLAQGRPFDLIREKKPCQHLRLEVGHVGIETAVDVVRTWGALDVSTRDGMIDFVANDWDGIPDLVAALVAEGARVYQLTADEPTLEDFYLALHAANDPTQLRT